MKKHGIIRLYYFYPVPYPQALTRWGFLAGSFFFTRIQNQFDEIPREATQTLCRKIRAKVCQPSVVTGQIVNQLRATLKLQ